MCIHETIQLSHDGERVIVCADCGREFGHIGRDERETFVAYAPEDHPVIVVADAGSETGLMVGTRHGQLVRKPTYPCATCRWQMSCEDEEGRCHTDRDTPGLFDRTE